MIAALVTALLILKITIGFILFITFTIYCKITTYTYIYIYRGDRAGAWNSYPSMDVYELLNDDPSPNVASHAFIANQNCVRINSS